jgi:hypothetical protein
MGEYIEPQIDSHVEDVAAEAADDTRRHSLTRRLAGIALTGCMAIGSMLMTSDSTAEADATVIRHVYRTDGDGLWMHPDSPRLSSRLSVVVPEGAAIEVECFERGDMVGGGDTPPENVWLKSRYKQHEGYVADYFVDTHWRTTDELQQQGIPRCGTPMAAEKEQAAKARASESSSQCTPYFIAGARGSGESFGKDGNAAGTEGFGGQIGPIANLLVKKLGAGSVETYGLPYTAAEAIDVVASPTDSYQQGMSTGKSMLGKVIKEQIAECADQKIILLGYSQGADVVADVASTLTAEQASHIAAVGLLGDPQFNPDSSTAAGDFNPGREGVFEAREEFPDTIAGKVINYCAMNDPICNYTIPDFAMLSRKTSAHYHYVDNGGVGSVTRFVERRK